MVKKKKVLILGNSHLVVFKFRGELIEKLVSEEYDVTVCFPKDHLEKGKKQQSGMVVGLLKTILT